MVDLAPGWWIRCPKCGKSKPYGAVGGIRLAAASRGKRVLAFCKDCRWFRMAIVEKRSEGTAKPSAQEFA